MQLIPAVDILGGAAVRLHQGDFGRAKVYERDPVTAAAGFVAAGASLVHVVDLEAARSGSVTGGLWESLGAGAIPFQAAGGIRDAATARTAFEAGASRVVFGTAAVWNPEVMRAVVTEAGPERVVGAVDIRDGMAFGSGWVGEGRPAGTVAAELVASGVGRIMVTAITRDGTLAGPDIDLLQRTVARVPVPVIAAGGIGSLDDLERVAETGVEAVVVGRALYERRFSLSEAILAVTASSDRSGQ